MEYIEEEKEIERERKRVRDGWLQPIFYRALTNIEEYLCTWNKTNIIPHDEKCWAIIIQVSREKFGKSFVSDSADVAPFILLWVYFQKNPMILTSTSTSTHATNEQKHMIYSTCRMLVCMNRTYFVLVQWNEHRLPRTYNVQRGKTTQFAMCWRRSVSMFTNINETRLLFAFENDLCRTNCKFRNCKNFITFFLLFKLRTQRRESIWFYIGFFYLLFKNESYHWK